jgi:hypothetical protein
LVAWEAEARVWDADITEAVAEVERLQVAVARLTGALAQARVRPELEAAMRVVLAQCGADVQAVVERLARERGLAPAQVVREVLGDWVKTRWAP